MGAKAKEKVMADTGLEKRVKKLESQIGELQKELRSAKKSKDWRRTIGAFTDDEGMQQILRDAMQLREADRKKGRARYKGKTQR